MRLPPTSETPRRCRLLPWLEENTRRPQFLCDAVQGAGQSTSGAALGLPWPCGRRTLEAGGEGKSSAAGERAHVAAEGQGSDKARDLRVPGLEGEGAAHALCSGLWLVGCLWCRQALPVSVLWCLREEAAKGATAQSSGGGRTERREGTHGADTPPVLLLSASTSTNDLPASSKLLMLACSGTVQMHPSTVCCQHGPCSLSMLPGLPALVPGVLQHGPYPRPKTATACSFLVSLLTCAACAVQGVAEVLAERKERAGEPQAEGAGRQAGRVCAVRPRQALGPPRPARAALLRARRRPEPGGGCGPGGVEALLLGAQGAPAAWSAWWRPWAPPSLRPPRCPRAAPRPGSVEDGAQLLALLRSPAAPRERGHPALRGPVHAGRHRRHARRGPHSKLPAPQTAPAQLLLVAASRGLSASTRLGPGVPCCC